MKQLLLIFLSSMLILLVGVFFGFNAIRKSFEISQQTRELASPLSINLDTDFIRKKSF